MKSACVAFKAHQGWINAVAVDARASKPLPIMATRIDLAAVDDRAVAEPYHVAGGWEGLKQVPRPDDPAQVVRKGRAAQVQAAKKQFRAFSKKLEKEDWQWHRAVVLTGRGRLGGDLEKILSAHSKIHIAEGEAVRDAVRSAAASLRLLCVDQEEKAVLVEAAARLKTSEGLCDEEMKQLKPSGAKTWRQEERLLALAAWLNRK